MYRSSFCLPSSTFSSFKQDFRPCYGFGKRLRQKRHNVRMLHLQDVDALSTGHQDIPHINGSNRHGDQKTTFIKKKAEDNKDIIIDDLSATLEAHRSTNRTKIHKVPSGCHSDPSSFDHSLARVAHRATKRTSTIRIRKIQSDHNLSRSSSGNDVVLGQTQTASADVETTCPEARTMSQSDAAANQASYKIRRMDGKLWHSTRNAYQKLIPIVDYEGVAKEPYKRWDPRSSEGRKPSPWLALVTNTEGDGLARLQNEIKAYENYMILKPYEMVVANSVLREIKSILKESDSSASVDVMGSYSSGLATPMSDLDLRLSLPSFDKDPFNRGPSPGRKASLKAGRKSLIKLQIALKHSKLFANVRLSIGRLEILNTVHRKTKLAVQVQFMPTPPASLPYITTYLCEFPTLRPLFILLRSALDIRGLKDVWTGGLGSYTIFMMIVYALNRNASELHRHDMAAQLLYILKLYSEADLYKYGFSADPPRMFDKSIVGKKGNSTAKLYGIDILCKHDMQPFLLCLQDPADRTKDLGGRSYAIKHVQAVFCSARERIDQALREWEAMSPSERQNLNKACLDPLVGACYNHFESQRARVKQAGDQLEEFKQEAPEDFFEKNRMFERPLRGLLRE